MHHSIEHKLRRVFGIDNYCLSRQSERLLTYGGIINADAIKMKGGLYSALTVTLALYYFKSVDKIDMFLEDISYISELKLDEIGDEKIKEIMKEFDLLIKDFRI